MKAKASQVVSVNSTSVSVWVDSWLDGGCPILYFVIEYQIADQNSWLLASKSVQANDRVYVVSDLKPGTKYNLRVTAHNNAGSTVAVYNFTTLTAAGGMRSIHFLLFSRTMFKVIFYTVVEICFLLSLSGTVSPNENDSQYSEDVPFYYNLKVIILVFVSSSIFTMLVATVAFIRRKSEFPDWFVGRPSDTIKWLEFNFPGMLVRHLATLSESPSIAQIQNEQNRDQQYLAIQVRNRTTKESDTGKANSEDYISDICPYATFRISKAPYAESNYGGNIYSGPYSSVKGSFVYHEGNGDDLKLKPVQIS